jgi:CDP-diacylglycerol---serine O-phosphatidyltransferase
MRKGIYLLPNSLTLCGMFMGFYSILSSLNGHYVNASYAIIIGMIFDGLDGWVARLTNSTTKFGIELDSLSDLVAFGVAPSVLLYKWALFPFNRIGWAAAFLFMACGALRLARYNVQMGSTESKAFTGMPIPAAATIVSSLVIFYHEVWDAAPGRNYYILLLTVVLAVLMVSTLKYHGAKEIDFSRRKPFLVLVAIVVLLTLVVMHPPITLFIFAMIYLIGGILENIIVYYRRGRQTDKAGRVK